MQSEKMHRCEKDCKCILCLQLRGCEHNLRADVRVSDNFILAKSSALVRNAMSSFAPRKYTFFGNSNFDNTEKFSTINSSADNIHQITESKVVRGKEAKLTMESLHKSVIYVNEMPRDENNNEEEVFGRNAVVLEERVDDYMSLDSVQDSRMVNVIFKQTFSYASQLFNDLNVQAAACCYSEEDDDSSDEFPIGAEAYYFNKTNRPSSNSRNEQTSYHEDMGKEATPTSTSLGHSKSTFPVADGNQSERMVSPKRKTEQFPQLYIANNVKTSSFSEQTTEKSSKCEVSKHMIPERDTNKSTSGLKIPTGQAVFKYSDIEDGGRPSHSARLHHHVSVQELRIQQRAAQQQGNSSSDENRSSGHASMSDTGHSSPRALSNQERPVAVVQKPARNRVNTQYNRSRHRATPAKLQVPWTGSGGLEDIKLALQQLTMRSHTSTSTYSSISAGSESSEPAMRRLMRHSSLETINTNITNADEFVWVDSHNRLVELQHLPWTNHCILRVLQTGRCREHMARVSVETIPRLSYLLQRALVRISRETQRLSTNLGLCTKHDIAVSFRIVLCPPLADSCIKACLRAAAMLAMAGDCTLRQSKSTRAGLQLHVGRFHRWMTDVKLARFIHEYAAVYLCAGLENLLEEILLQCVPSDSDVTLTATLLEHAIANNGDLWGLLQPYAHLNAGRIASGALALPRWVSVSSLGSSRDSGRGSGPPEPSLMTTCVGSLTELQDLINRMQTRIPLCPRAVRTLFYFMRCSQLEHGEQGASAVQELCYERAYVVLPPLVEWLRVATAHGEHRFAAILDKDDIMQAARLLLPGVDCPVRSLGEEAVRIKRLTGGDDDHIEASRQIQVELAFRLMLTGRSELIQQALSLLPLSTRLDTLDQQGHTALMISALNNDDTTLMGLLDAGASVDTETPASASPNFNAVNGETQHWTALTYASSKGHARCARILLERGASVEGGAQLSEDKSTLTPLQVASSTGNADMIALLLSYGAHPFLSTILKDTLCYAASAQRGCYSPISVAAAHGQRSILQKLLSQPVASMNKEVLSLEEMLAEGAASTQSQSSNTTPQFSKTQIKALQEAMYHSAENNHLDITVEIRSFGIPWTLHCWMHSLGAAHEARLDCVIDQLLQDFLQVCPDDYSSQFVQECLPLLFNIFRYSKKEGTTLLLADIFSTCFGWEAIKPIKDCVLTTTTASRIDPKYVNNPELSDVTFRVEGRLFYAHKIVLVTASPRLRAMLSSKLCEGGLPTVQINDIRYHIFQIVMQFLYQGGCQTLEPAPEDILELMAAANFFQLDGLLRYCEGRCAAMLVLDNVVSMYIHAKVYNALQLLEYCQGFLLQNMVALLTYDDSVKRLLFAKKLPNHDVLAGLLNTLQNRIKTRRSQICKSIQQQQGKACK
ncbi:PREDICTED: ankyrin repeat and BTB/POZ domain-containing protein 2 [Nicrophorus vespilloides]|uniref:Ankyrin repeat and BTB/POZ domain-containing protein 2 n=1 Tax=Nicrophorus vespilloides TaxID=110193 RepID=A0ABM1M022_NICVS|nr:PREDICTED: ankyrin repeat and BTB/POZ domain-containing protein 2 [Nicrophorus vespilloides]